MGGHADGARHQAERSAGAADQGRVHGWAEAVRKRECMVLMAHIKQSDNNNNICCPAVVSHHNRFSLPSSCLHVPSSCLHVPTRTLLKCMPCGFISATVCKKHVLAHRACLPPPASWRSLCQAPPTPPLGRPSQRPTSAATSASTKPRTGPFGEQRA